MQKLPFVLMVQLVGPAAEIENESAEARSKRLRKKYAKVALILIMSRFCASATQSTKTNFD